MSIIEKLELSVRASNVLRARGRVNTLDDFMALTREEVVAQPNAGEQTWREIARVQKYITTPHVVPPVPARSAALTALRDAAALAALTVLAQRAYYPIDTSGCPDEEALPRVAARVARHSFLIADAFIAARDAKADE